MRAAGAYPISLLRRYGTRRSSAFDGLCYGKPDHLDRDHHSAGDGYDWAVSGNHRPTKSDQHLYDLRQIGYWLHPFKHSDSKTRGPQRKLYNASEVCTLRNPHNLLIFLPCSYLRVNPISCGVDESDLSK